MMIDGYSVEKGDSVFVIGIGSGIVQSVSADGGFRIKTGGGIITAMSGGFIGRVRRVYWDNPFIISPPKNPKIWKAFKDMAHMNYNSIITLCKTGEVKGVFDEEKI